MEQEFLKFANYLVDEAAVIARKYFRGSLIIDSKDNSTPVTIADREIELKLRELINQNYPEHSIIGEEYGDKQSISQYCWVLDPIDGTVAFSTGKPTFTTLVALLKDNNPVLSIINQPISNERFIGEVNHRATLNHHVIKTSQTEKLSESRLNATTPYMFLTDYEKQSFDKLRKQVRLTSFGGDAYSFGLLASGHIDIILEADLQYYDVAALVPVIEASGGVISDWQGNVLTKSFNGQCLASANKELHIQVLELINN